MQFLTALKLARWVFSIDLEVKCHRMSRRRHKIEDEGPDNTPIPKRSKVPTGFQPNPPAEEDDELDEQ